MDNFSTESFNFTPTEDLIMELLTARYRLGETSWSISAKNNKTLTSLETKGLVDWKHASVEHYSLVWFTDKGKALCLAYPYEIPLLKQDKPKKVAKKLTKNASKLRKRFTQD